MSLWRRNSQGQGFVFTPASGGRGLGIAIALGTVLGLGAGSSAQSPPPNQVPLNPEARAFVSKNRWIEHKQLKSVVLGREESYAVELPASYTSEKSRRYPVLYFLHGQFGNENDWERNGMNEVFEKMEADHEISEMIVVLPNGGSSFFINSLDGTSRYEDFLIHELIPQIDKDYRTLPRRETRGIMGVSMGGFGALTLAMKYSSLFSVVAAHSAALLEEIPQPSSTDRRMQFRLQLAQRVFGNPIDPQFWAQNNPILLAETLKSPSPLKIYFDCGEQDRFGFYVGAEAFHRALNKRQIAHEFHLFPGNHGWEYARSVAPKSFKFVSDALPDARKSSEPTRKSNPAGR